jgi:hypothetical protein
VCAARVFVACAVRLSVCVEDYSHPRCLVVEGGLTLEALKEHDAALLQQMRGELEQAEMRWRTQVHPLQQEQEQQAEIRQRERDIALLENKTGTCCLCRACVPTPFLLAPRFAFGG